MKTNIACHVFYWGLTGSSGLLILHWLVANCLL